VFIGDGMFQGNVFPADPTATYELFRSIHHGWSPTFRFQTCSPRTFRMWKFSLLFHSLRVTDFMYWMAAFINLAVLQRNTLTAYPADRCGMGCDGGLHSRLPKREDVNLSCGNPNILMRYYPLIWKGMYAKVCQKRSKRFHRGEPCNSCVCRGFGINNIRKANSSVEDELRKIKRLSTTPPLV
jgi:hypothetical protein